MTKTTTKIAVASLLAFGFATSAFASDASEVQHQDVNQAVYAQQTQAWHARGADAYAYAPEQYNTTYDSAGHREFNRVDIDTVSSR